MILTVKFVHYGLDSLGLHKLAFSIYKKYCVKFVWRFHFFPFICYFFVRSKLKMCCSKNCVHLVSIVLIGLRKHPNFFAVFQFFSVTSI